jgi:3-methyladenine DNA glycosylase/8-oxoguanine DNA glycosylase
MAAAYDLPDATAAEVAHIARRWCPYGSWAALLFRTDREETTGEITHGHRAVMTGRNDPG